MRQAPARNQKPVSRWRNATGAAGRDGEFRPVGVSESAAEYTSNVGVNVGATERRVLEILAADGCSTAKKNRRRAGENSAPGGTYSKKAPGKGAHPPNRLGQIRLLGSPRKHCFALTPAPAARPRDAFLSNRELSRMNANLFARERQQGIPVREAGNEENLKRFSNSQLNRSGFARIAFSRSFSASFMASW